MVQSMMRFKSLSISFWGYTLETTCHILNRILSKSVTKIPYEIWTGRRPILSYLRIWDYSTYVKCLRTDKLRLWSDKCYFMEYLKKTKGYYFYFAEE